MEGHRLGNLRIPHVNRPVGKRDLDAALVEFFLHAAIELASHAPLPDGLGRDPAPDDHCRVLKSVHPKHFERLQDVRSVIGIVLHFVAELLEDGHDFVRILSVGDADIEYIAGIVPSHVDDSIHAAVWDDMHAAAQVSESQRPKAHGFDQTPVAADIYNLADANLVFD